MKLRKRQPSTWLYHASSLFAKLNWATTSFWRVAESAAAPSSAPVPDIWFPILAWAEGSRVRKQKERHMPPRVEPRDDRSNDCLFDFELALHSSNSPTVILALLGVSARRLAMSNCRPCVDLKTYEWAGDQLQKLCSFLRERAA